MQIVIQLFLPKKSFYEILHRQPLPTRFKTAQFGLGLRLEQPVSTTRTLDGRGNALAGYRRHRNPSCRSPGSPLQRPRENACWCVPPWVVYCPIDKAEYLFAVIIIMGDRHFDILALQNG